MRYLGIICEEKGDYAARVKVLCYINDEGKISEDDSLKNPRKLEKKFPPNGLVFLTRRKNKHEGDTITFSKELIESYEIQSQSGKDNFLIVLNSVKPYFTEKIYKSSDCIFFDENKSYIKENINSTLTEIKNRKENFYLYNQGCLFGRFKIKDKKIIPVIGKEIKYWNADDKKLPILKYDRHYDLMLKKEVGCKHKIADCMDSTQLSTWFQKKLGIIDNILINELFNKSQWRENLKKSVNFCKNADEKNLVEIRVGRISDNLNSVDAIIKLKEEIEIKKSEFEKGIDSLRKEIENKKNELSDLKNKIAKQEGLNLEKKALNDHLESDKERLLKDFKIFSGINPQPKLPAECKQVKNYRLEVVESDDSILDDRESIIKRMEYYLSSNGLNSKYAEFYLKHIESYKFIFIPDVKIAKAFVEAAGKSKYILQQVGCDWLNFRTLWDNGFSEIWESSCNNPDLLHILILQDINLSSPECWGKPLFDLIRGVRDKVPYSNTEWPANLRITATVLPFDNPPIALPLYQGTFMECGVIEKRKDLLSENDTKEPAEHAEGYFISPLLEKHFKIDELEQSNSRDELNKLDDYFKG